MNEITKVAIEEARNMDSNVTNNDKDKTYCPKCGQLTYSTTGGCVVCGYTRTRR